MPDDPRDIVESGYDAIAERYADAIRAGRGPQTYFRTFLARVLERIPEEGPSWIWDAEQGSSPPTSRDMPVSSQWTAPRGSSGSRGGTHRTPRSCGQI
jgi:hypothetical protein